MPSNLEIGKRLKRLRKSRGWTLEDVAKLLGLSVATVSFYESGNRIPKDENKVALAKLFEKTVESIFYADDVNY